MAEMAIVMTVIALLIAVVAGGYSIKKASEIRGVIADIQQFQGGIEGFLESYKALPGDMINATSYWSNTQNGNGDGNVSYALTGNNESLRAWQHLSLAGFVEGNYTGEMLVAGQADIGGNIPASRRTKVGYTYVTGNIAGGTEKLQVRVGGFHAGHMNDASAFTPTEAKSLDGKLDDGYPTTGGVVAAAGSDVASDRCISGSSLSYLVSEDKISCVLAFSAFP